MVHLRIQADDPPVRVGSSGEVGDLHCLLGLVGTGLSKRGPTSSTSSPQYPIQQCTHRQHLLFMHCLASVLSTGAVFTTCPPLTPPQGWRCSCHTWGCCWHPEGQFQDAAKPAKMHRAAPHNKELSVLTPMMLSQRTYLDHSQRKHSEQRLLPLAPISRKRKRVRAPEGISRPFQKHSGVLECRQTFNLFQYLALLG